MFFDALWLAAYQLIKEDCPALLVYLSSFMSLPLWISSLPVPARTPCGDIQSHPSDISPDLVPLLRIPLFNSGATNSTERVQAWAEIDDERRKGMAGLRPRTLFATVDDSPPSSPSDTPSENLGSPVPLHHPRPKQASPIIVKPASSLIDRHSPSTTPERASSPEEELSRPPSLVPTIIVSRSPSPRPHPCISEAQELGIKVRDFAFEDHAVPLAPVVPDLDQLKARYLLYRTAELTPPPDVVRKLKELDQEWIEENARHFDNQTTNPRPRSSRVAWRRETKRWLGIIEDVPISASEESCEVGEMTAKLKAIELVGDARGG